MYFQILDECFWKCADSCTMGSEAEYHQFEQVRGGSTVFSGEGRIANDADNPLA